MRTTATMRLCAPLALAFAAAPAFPATYYWKPGNASGLWSELSNWSTASKTGADASALPGSGDALDENGDFWFDLGGETRDIGAWNAGGAVHSRHYLTVENGTLRSNGDWKESPMTVTVKSGATFVHAAGSFLPSQDSSDNSYVMIESGGAFRLEGAANPKNLVFDIAEGGTMDFPLSGYWGMPNKGSNNGNAFVNRGVLNMPKGLVYANGASSGGKVMFRQLGGTLNVGGPLNGKTSGSRKNLSVSFEFAGGTINATGTAAILNAASISLSGATTWNVAAGVTIDLSAATADSPSVEKNGDGALKLPDLPTTLRWNGGDLVLAAQTTAAMDALALGAGRSLVLSVPNLSIATLEKLAGALSISKPGLVVSAVADSADLSGDVTVDLASFATGGTVVTTPSAALRAKFLAAAQSAIASAGSQLVATDDGSSVTLAPAGLVKVFESTAVSDMADASGWREGEIPAAGEPALVSGAGVVAELSAAALAKGWSGVTVQAGATLRLVADPGSLPIVLDDGASLSVADGVTVGAELASSASSLVLEPGAELSLAEGETFDISAAVETRADESRISRIVAAGGSTLSIPGDYAFKNVALALAGAEIVQTGLGAISFGSAGDGETTRFAMSASDVTMRLADGLEGTPSGYGFGVAEGEGRVQVDGEIVLARVTFPGAAQNWSFGKGNSEEEEFNVVLDGTGVSWKNGLFAVSGGAALVVSNSATVVSSAVNGNADAIEVSGAGQIVIGQGGTVFHPVSGSGNTRMKLRGAETVRPALKLTGGTFEPYKMDGTYNTRTINVAADSVWQVFEDTYWWDGIRNIPLDGAARTDIAEGATLAIRNRKYTGWDGGDNTGVWLADAPIAGAGSVALENTYAGKKFAVTVRNGNNTATGTISADDASALRFANGANWAGTVIAAGNVSLVNLDDSAAPARVAFGTLRLEENLELRLYADGSSDAIDFGEGGVAGAGALSFIAGEEDFDPTQSGKKWTIGSIPEGAALPPLAEPGWQIVTTASGEEGRQNLIMHRLFATIVIFR